MKIYKFSGNTSDFLQAVNGDYIDCLEGTLLDDLLIYGNNGYIAMFETYQNSNCSIYTIYEPETEKDNNDITALWDNRMQTREKQYREIEENYKRFAGGSK